MPDIALMEQPGHSKRQLESPIEPNVLCGETLSYGKGEEEPALWVCTTDYEQSAAAALLGLHTSVGWGSPQSPDSPQVDSDPELMGGWGGMVSGYVSPGASCEVAKMPRLRYAKDGAHPPCPRARTLVSRAPPCALASARCAACA